MRGITATALLVASTCLPVSAAPEAKLADYLALVRRYASGEHSQAVAALGGWSRGDLDRMFRLIDAHQRNRERCPACPNPIADGPWQAAAMLHWDRDRSERPQFAEPEEQRRCTGDQARVDFRITRQVEDGVPIVATLPRGLPPQHGGTAGASKTRADLPKHFIPRNAERAPGLHILVELV